MSIFNSPRFLKWRAAQLTKLRDQPADFLFTVGAAVSAMLFITCVVPVTGSAETASREKADTTGPAGPASSAEKVEAHAASATHPTGPADMSAGQPESEAVKPKAVKPEALPGAKAGSVVPLHLLVEEAKWSGPKGPDTHHCSGKLKEEGDALDLDMAKQRAESLGATCLMYQTTEHYGLYDGAIAQGCGGCTAKITSAYQLISPGFEWSGFSEGDSSSCSGRLLENASVHSFEQAFRISTKVGASCIVWNSGSAKEFWAFDGEPKKGCEHSCGSGQTHVMKKVYYGDFDPERSRAF